MSTTKNLTIDQGSIFYANLQYVDNSKNPISLAGYTLTSQIRKSYYSANAASFTTTVIDAANGKFQLFFSSNDTGLIKPGRYVYDVEAASGSESIRIIEGEVTVTPGVTGNTYGTIFVSTEAIRGLRGVPSNILVSGNGTYIANFNNNGDFELPNASNIITSYGGLDLVAPPNSYVEMADAESKTYMWIQGESAWVGTNWTGISHAWEFNKAGNLLLPGGSIIDDGVDGTLHLTPAAGRSIYLNSKNLNTGIGISPTNILIYTDDNNVGYGWFFNADGTTTFPNNLIKPQNNNSISLGNYTDNHDDNKVTINQHTIDIYAYNDNVYSYSEVFLDNEDPYSPYAYIEIRDQATNQAQWKYNANGKLTLPPHGIITTTATMGSAVTIKAPASGPAIIKNDAGYNSLTVQDSDVRLSTSTSIPYDISSIISSTGSWEMNPQSNLGTTGGTGTGLTVNVTESGGYADTITIQDAGSGYNNGDEITVTSGTSSAVFTILTHVKTWKFGADGVTTLPFPTRYPSTARGVDGDKAGMMVVAGAYLYYCYADYTDGSVPIWQKVSMDNTDWD